MVFSMEETMTDNSYFASNVVNLWNVHYCLGDKEEVVDGMKSFLLKL